jgi:hypothetical protein
MARETSTAVPNQPDCRPDVASRAGRDDPVGAGCYPPPVQGSPRPETIGRLRGELLLATSSVCAVLVLLGVLELTLRLLRPTPCPGATDESVMACLHSYSEVYGWDLRPGARLEVRDLSITIDQKGRRTAPHAPVPEGRRTRLLVLGDSLAFGLEVGDEETFSFRLQADGDDFEVLNWSVPGFGTDQALIKLQREGLAQRPDVVILSFCRANDLVDNTLPTFLYDGIHPKPFFRLEQGELRHHDEHLRLSRSTRIGLALGESSYLYGALSALAGQHAVRAREQQAARTGLPHWQTRANDALRSPEPALALTAALITRMRDLLAEGDGELVVLSYPTRRTFDSEATELAGDLRARLAAAGIPCVLMGQRFRSRGFEYGDLTEDGLGHLSPTGHRVAAEIIRELMSEMGLTSHRTSHPTGG